MFFIDLPGIEYNEYCLECQLRRPTMPCRSWFHWGENRTTTHSNCHQPGMLFLNVAGPMSRSGNSSPVPLYLFQFSSKVMPFWPPIAKIWILKNNTFRLADLRNWIFGLQDIHPAAQHCHHPKNILLKVALSILREGHDRVS